MNLIRIHDYAELLKKYPAGRLMFINAGCSAEADGAGGYAANACAEFLLICDEIESDAGSFDAKDIARLRETRVFAARRLALMVVAERSAAPRPPTQ